MINLNKQEFMNKMLKKHIKENRHYCWSSKCGNSTFKKCRLSISQCFIQRGYLNKL